MRIRRKSLEVNNFFLFRLKKKRYKRNTNNDNIESRTESFLHFVHLKYIAQIEWVILSKYQFLD